jgi:hypothetical protein
MDPPELGSSLCQPCCCVNPAGMCLDFKVRRDAIPMRSPIVCGCVTGCEAAAAALTLHLALMARSAVHADLLLSACWMQIVVCNHHKARQYYARRLMNVISGCKETSLHGLAPLRSLLSTKPAGNSQVLVID